jgi:glycosyltransferase involved in cell wall biosynthesis
MYGMGKFRLEVFNTQSPYVYKGGVERRINEVGRRLVGEVDVTVYSGTKAGFKQSVSVGGVCFVPLGSTDRVYPLDSWSFNRSVARTVFGADVFEVHNDSGYGLLRAFKKNSAMRGGFVHTVHGVLADEVEQAKLYGHLSFRGRVANCFLARLAGFERKTVSEADLVVTVSRYSLGKLQKFYDVDSSRVRVVPNGVDVERFRPVENQVGLKRLFGLGEDGPVVLFVGSLIPRKGVLFLVEVAKQVVKMYPKVRFVIVGGGPLRGLLVDRLTSEKLLGNFVFKCGLGEEELSLLYGCCDVFVLPSIQEGQGIVLLEASASGRPVVGFDVGGVGEVVVDGETGLLVGCGCLGEFVEALLRLLGDGLLRRRLGLAGRRFVCEKFTWDTCAQRMLGVYREAMDFVL